MDAIDKLLENNDEIIEVMNLYVEKNQGKKKNNHTHVAITKSSMVMLVATWEAFIEDTCSEGLEFIVTNTASPKDLPKPLKQMVCEEIKNNPNELKMWDLAESGWKSLLKEHKKAMLSKYLGGFNTPNADNIDKLFKTVLGINDTSKCWHWRGLSSKKASNKLKSLISLRGEIAHRVNASKKITPEIVGNYGLFILKIAVRTHNHIGYSIKENIGTAPWQPMEPIPI